MVQSEVTNDSGNQYTMRTLSPRLRSWWRYAFDQRERRGTAKATIQTFVEGKGLSSAEVTELMGEIRA